MMGPELVFSVMDLMVGALLMIVTFIWFRSKHVARFYEACKVQSAKDLQTNTLSYTGKINRHGKIQSLFFQVLLIVVADEGLNFV